MNNAPIIVKEMRSNCRTRNKKPHNRPLPKERMQRTDCTNASKRHLHRYIPPGSSIFAVLDRFPFKKKNRNRFPKNLKKIAEAPEMGWKQTCFNWSLVIQCWKYWYRECWVKTRKQMDAIVWQNALPPKKDGMKNVPGMLWQWRSHCQMALSHLNLLD